MPVPDRHFGHQIEDIHETFGKVLMYLAAAHAAVALLHHFWQRDNTLRRMLPPAGAED
ncbi:MAG: cytochrome b/b6 domain-containing protein [Rhodanobacteraceae bacterium]